MATISKGITIKVADNLLTNLQEIPELGGTRESIEITTLGDDAHMYTDGILNYGDNIAFKFLYEKEQFTTLNGLTGTQNVVVTLPDASTCTFTGTCSVKLDGVGINAPLTYTLNVKPNSAMVWA
ncbi:MAG: hypothetical protein SOZ53_02360 [Candidatus Onthovivens sp.]|nr:hypothetical protein [Candidatus Onthovivens sp.]